MEVPNKVPATVDLAVIMYQLPLPEWQQQSEEAAAAAAE